MQSLAQQHSNSSTPTQGGLMQTGSLGLGSPWGSFTAGSSSGSAADLQMAGLVRRVSSPAGHSASLTPRSNCSFTGGQDDTASMQSMQGMQLQLGGGIAAAAAARGGAPVSSSLSGWPTHLLQLPNDLGLGDSCGDAPAGLLQQQQQQQLLMQASLGSEVMGSMLPGGMLGVNASGSFASIDMMGRGAADCSSSDVSGMLAGAVPPPPPPPASQQQGIMGAPPPPPPRGNGDGYNAYGSSDGRLSGDYCAGAFHVPAKLTQITAPNSTSSIGLMIDIHKETTLCCSRRLCQSRACTPAQGLDAQWLLYLWPGLGP
jgi:hypothetical protein